ncbi:hypothetical protein [Geobacter sp.]|uniref:hypothetical protein n=1 Tax=Geobacter sp. TaxID=46610 RepID=UPI002620DDBC|nr:hypothetical protein [Geobacter sp.]
MTAQQQTDSGRPRCPKCRSTALRPERSIFTGRVEAVACITCGERVYREFRRRSPSRRERQNAPGIPHHKESAQ